MKRLKQLFYAKLNTLLGAVLTLLEFSGCDILGVDDPFNEVCLYGQPYAIYNVKGAVLNDEGDKLEGIEITIKSIYRYEDKEYQKVWWMEKKPTTDKEGKYEYKGNESPYSTDVIVRVVAEDPKGVYAADSTDVNFTSTDEGKGDWCDGTVKGTADFKLKRLENKE